MVLCGIRIAEAGVRFPPGPPNNMTNSWDSVAEEFNTYKPAIWWGAVDNIATVWPIFLDYIKNNSTTSKRALEFGCGTGMFCLELKKLGYEVTGIDISPEMIKIGKKNLDSSIKLLVGGPEIALEQTNQYGKFDLVSSIMVLQFIEDVNLKLLANSIKQNGHIIFTNHSPLMLEARGVEDHFFVGPNKVPVRIYKRTAEDYDKIFLNLGFKKTLETSAQSSPEVMEKYAIDRPLDIRKYLILAYQKI